MTRGKKKVAGHYCRICGRHRANEKFGGRGHARHICKDCENAMKREARQKAKLNADQLQAPEAGIDEEFSLDVLLFDEDSEMIADELDSDALSPTQPRGNSKKDIPYETFDPNIVGLVRALNRYPGLMTIGSCGGHEIITNPSQWVAGTWYVKFDLHADRLGWYVLEHLAWAINEAYRGAGHHVILLPTAPPPYLNTPGQCLHFVVEGYEGEDPDKLAHFLESVRKHLTKKRR